MAIGYRCEGCSLVRAEKWRGTCPGCGGFYSIRRTVSSEGIEEGPPPRGEPVTLNQVTAISQERISTGFEGFDRILGTDPVTQISGIAARAGQAIQIYGSPGCGKSTLLLQICRNLARQREKILYIAGEESLQQIKLRADRIGKFGSQMVMLDENELDSILYQMDEIAPSIIVVDSLQTITVEDYAQGSLTAMRLAARELYKYSQTNGVALFLVVQINKLGDDFAGPKEVEHIVDTSLFLRLDRKNRRMLESVKNRFGQAPAEQLFEMTEAGMVEIVEKKKTEDAEEEDGTQEVA